MIEGEIKHFFLIPFILGILGGISAYGFRLLVKLFNYFYNFLDFIHTNYFYIFTMPLVFYISNYLITKFLKNQSNVTIDEIAKKISMMSGKFSYIKGFLVLFLTSISIGFGVPIGREGPIAKLGGLMSEIFMITLKAERINLPIYLSAGVSAAISATFNAPIAGIIFGIEIIIGKVNSYIIIPLMVACTTSTIFARIFIGNYTAFYVPNLSYKMHYFIYLPIAAIFFAIISIILIHSLNFLKKLRKKYSKNWKFIIIFIGITVGIIINISPETKGVGYNYISNLYTNEYIGKNIFNIMLFKLIAVILSIGSGIFGGLMSPSIFIGSFGGYWFGTELLDINNMLDPKVFALIGSAAMLSGIAKAPLRSSIIIIELTHSYQLLLPLLITSAITTYIVSKTDSGSYFKRSLLQVGIDIEDKGIIDFLDKYKLDKLVKKVPAINPNTSLKRILPLFKRYKINYLSVTDSENNLIGVISLRDVRKSSLFYKKKLKVRDLMSKTPFAIYQHHKKENIYKALSMLNANFIPYITEDKKYIGMLNMNLLLRELTHYQQKYDIR